MSGLASKGNKQGRSSLPSKATKSDTGINLISIFQDSLYTIKRVVSINDGEKLKLLVAPRCYNYSNIKKFLPDLHDLYYTDASGNFKKFKDQKIKDCIMPYGFSFVNNVSKGQRTSNNKEYLIGDGKAITDKIKIVQNAEDNNRHQEDGKGNEPKEKLNLVYKREKRSTNKVNDLRSGNNKIYYYGNELEPNQKLKKIGISVDFEYDILYSLPGSLTKRWLQMFRRPETILPFGDDINKNQFDLEFWFTNCVTEFNDFYKNFGFKRDSIHYGFKIGDLYFHYPPTTGIDIEKARFLMPVKTVFFAYSLSSDGQSIIFYPKFEGLDYNKIIRRSTSFKSKAYLLGYDFLNSNPTYDEEDRKYKRPAEPISFHTKKIKIKSRLINLAKEETNRNSIPEIPNEETNKNLAQETNAEEDEEEVTERDFTVKLNNEDEKIIRLPLDQRIYTLYPLITNSEDISLILFSNGRIICAKETIRKIGLQKNDLIIAQTRHTLRQFI